jgi:hypothetical protein
MQASPAPSQDVQQPTLALVVDAHNIGCVVRFIGERTTHRAQYAEAIQQHGVVIRTGHLGVVDRRHEPLAVMWRTASSVATVEVIANGHITLNLGYRQVGDRVLLNGSLLEQAAITDVLIDGELSHPERAQARLEQGSERRSQRPEA